MTGRKIMRAPLQEGLQGTNKKGCRTVRAVLMAVLCGLSLCWAGAAGAADAVMPEASDTGTGTGTGGLPFTEAATEPVAAANAEERGAVPAVWQPLLEQLAADGISGPLVEALFVDLGPLPTQDPMGRKMRELYTKTFLRKAPDPNAPKMPRPRLYKNVVTEANAQRCREFLALHAASFAQAEAHYGVPQEIAVALLFVETRLGTSLGKDNALYTLASMATSTTPSSIPDWLPQLPGYESRLDWLQELMPKRADWAYKEMRALVVHVLAQGVEPTLLPGSIYGAVGICQFMPSNLVPYGADGDGDGVIDLFTVPDAVESLSNYLAKHGWKKNMTRAAQHAILKKYNRVDIYANTIMALGDKISGRNLPLPTDVAKVAPAKKKKAVQP